jgi:hypothetical protein
MICSRKTPDAKRSNAQRGYFDIQDRDAFSPEFKKVRVVTTVRYFLAED